MLSNLSPIGKKRYDWTTERAAEVDIIIQRKGKIIHVQVKSADNVKARCLAENA